MSESNDFTPSSWGGTDFKAAEKEYAKRANTRARDYEVDPVAAKKVARELLPESITTKSTSPLVICVDTTGSMGKWPSIIFGKLGYLDYEMRTEYLGEDAQVCFCAVGDANNNEKYPLQVVPFAKEEGTKEALTKLVIEGGGGGTMQETYEHAALWFARNCNMPKAVRKPILLFIGDESPYDSVSVENAKKYCGVTGEGIISTPAIFKELMEKFSVHLIRKPYGSSGSASNVRSGADKQVYDAWAKLIGEDRIWDLGEPERVVDVIFGLLARETNKVKYFKGELKDRQKPEQVKTVMTSLRMDETEADGTDEGKGKVRGPLPKKKRKGDSVLKKPGGRI